MKLITLNKFKKSKHSGAPTHAMVDDEDYDYIDQFNWSVIKKYKTNRFYVFRNIPSKDPSGKRGHILLHREVMKVYDPKIQIDHIDHDGLNNQKSNLRKCINEENQRNTRSRSWSTSKYLGVCFEKESEKWKAYIRMNVNGKRKSKSLGRFDSEIEAAVARDNAAKIHYGEFANLNFK